MISREENAKRKGVEPSVYQTDGKKKTRRGEGNLDSRLAKSIWGRELTR